MRQEGLCETEAVCLKNQHKFNRLSSSNWQVLVVTIMLAPIILTGSFLICFDSIHFMSFPVLFSNTVKRLCHMV